MGEVAIFRGEILGDPRWPGEDPQIEAGCCTLNILLGQRFNDQALNRKGREVFRELHLLVEEGL